MSQSDFLSRVLAEVPPEVERWERIWHPHYRQLTSIKHRLKTVNEEEASQLLLALCLKTKATGEELRRKWEQSGHDFEATINEVSLDLNATANKTDWTAWGRRIIEELDRIPRLSTHIDFFLLDSALLQELIDRHGVSLASGPIILNAYNLGILKILRQRTPLLLANERLLQAKLLRDIMEPVMIPKWERKLARLDEHYQSEVSSLLMGAQMRGKQLRDKHMAPLRDEVEDLARDAGISDILNGKPFVGEIKRRAKIDALRAVLDWVPHIDHDTGTIPLTKKEADWFEKRLDEAVAGLRRKQRASGPLLSAVDMSEWEWKLLPDPSENPSEALFQSKSFESLIAQVPKNTHAIFDMKAQGYTVAEIADEMKLTMDQVNGKIKRARAKQSIKNGEK